MKKVLLLAMFILSFSAFAEDYTVTVKFNSQESAKEYITWMSEQGEQDMFIWMDENRPSLSIVPEYDYENLVIDFQNEEESEENL